MSQPIQNRKIAKGGDVNYKSIQSLAILQVSQQANEMAFQVKAEYGGKRFAAFLLENISYDGLVSSSIKKNCSSLAHVDADKIRLRYGYGERLSSRIFFFFFLRSRRKGFVRRKKLKTTTNRKQSFNLKKN